MTSEQEVERLRRHVDTLQSKWNKAENELVKVKARLFDILHPEHVETPQESLKAIIISHESKILYLTDDVAKLIGRCADLVKENRRLMNTVETLMKKITSGT